MRLPQLHLDGARGLSCASAALATSAACIASTTSSAALLILPIASSAVKILPLANLERLYARFRLLSLVLDSESLVFTAKKHRAVHCQYAAF